MKINAPITVALLDAAPVDSWLVEDYGYSTKTIFRKQADGTWLPGGRNRFGHSSQVMVSGAQLLKVTQTLHHPGLVKITGHRVIPPHPEMWWHWFCKVDGCSDESVGYFDLSVAQFHARKHLEYHAEAQSEVATWARCVTCGQSLPLADLAKHYARSECVA